MGTTLDITKFDSKKIHLVKIIKLNAMVNDNVEHHGGTLSINVSIGITDLLDGKYIDAKARLSIRGVPKGDSMDTAFEIEVHSKARWTFDATFSEITKAEKSAIAESLCQPAFLLAVTEAKSIADKFRVGYISLPFDLTTLKKEEAEHKKVSKLKSKSKVKPATKKAADKNL